MDSTQAVPFTVNLSKTLAFERKMNEVRVAMRDGCFDINDYKIRYMGDCNMSELKYEDGDEVYIVKERTRHMNNDGAMDKYLGQKLTVKCNDSDYHPYKMVGVQPWCWSNEMIDHEKTARLHAEQRRNRSVLDMLKPFTKEYKVGKAELEGVHKKEMTYSVNQLEEGFEYVANGHSNLKFKVVDEKLMQSSNSEHYVLSQIPYNRIIDREFTECEFNPSKDEKYHFPSFFTKSGLYSYSWKGDHTDYNIKAIVGVYRTEKQAKIKARELGWLND